MIRTAILAIALLATSAAAMRLNPLAISDMIEDRRPVSIPIPASRGEIPKPIPIGLKPWPAEGTSAPNLLRTAQALPNDR
jgi:hypothetical protein